ncbi:MAG: GNAT family N-acetyltransferase [Pseudomonadota bacterium]
MTERLQVDITYVEMHTAPAHAPRGGPDGAAIRELQPPSVSFYRYLYNSVGRPWLWYERRLLEDDALAAIIKHPQVVIDVLFVHNNPAGFCEFDLRRWPELEIAYFGLMPDFIGQGLGPYFLDACIRAGWARGPRRLWLHTCTLDHPKALRTYLNAGFAAYRTETVHIVDPRTNGVMARGGLP